MALNLKTNTAVEWVLDRLKNTQWSGVPNAAEAALFQQCAMFHAAMSVKESGEVYSEDQRNAACAKGYETWTAMAFLKSLNEDCHFDHLPSWLSKDIMGRNTMGDKVLRDAKTAGTKGKLYLPTEKVIWRAFTQACRAMRDEWNPAYDSLLEGGPGEKPRSGEQDSDVMEQLHEEMWKKAPQSQKKVRKIGKKGSGGVGGAAGATAAATAVSGGEAGAAAIAGEGVTELIVSVEQPVNWVHKYSLIFAFLGRPAGDCDEYHCLALQAGSGPDVDEVEGAGDGDGGAGEDVKPAAAGKGGLKSRGGVKSLKKEGGEGAGLPASRKQKREEKAAEEKEARRHKRQAADDERNDRILAAIEKPQETRVDLALIGYLNSFADQQTQAAHQQAQADIKEKREYDLKTLRELVELERECGTPEELKVAQRALMKLLREPLPTHVAPVPSAIRTQGAGGSAAPTATPSSNGAGPPILDLTAGAAEEGEDYDLLEADLSFEPPFGDDDAEMEAAAKNGTPALTLAGAWAASTGKAIPHVGATILPVAPASMGMVPPPVGQATLPVAPAVLPGAAGAAGAAAAAAVGRGVLNGTTAPSHGVLHGGVAAAAAGGGGTVHGTPAPSHGLFHGGVRAPLEHALAEGDKKLALTLLKAGADGGAGWEGCDGRTLLAAAAEGGSHKAVSAVLEAGGLEELNAVSGEQNITALHHATAGGHTDAARALILAGAVVGVLDAHDRSPLHYAVEGGHLKLAEYMVIGGADLTAEDDDGDTPLHLAAAHGDQAFVSTLLRRGASASATNKKRHHPLHVAIEHERVAVAEALLEAGADPNILYMACNDVAMTRTLVKYGADVEWVDGLGFTALGFAAAVGEADVVEALVDAGADVAARSAHLSNPMWGGDFEEVTALHAAAILCNPEGVSALLRRGADVNAIDGNGHTPLHVLCKVPASENADDEERMAVAADILLRGAADETLTDNDGLTPKQLIEGASVTRPLQEVLANAPADRAWRRRGMLVMCRALPDKMPTTGGKGRAGKAKARRGRRGGGGSAGGGQGTASVLTRVVELDDDAVFRTIIEFL